MSQRIKAISRSRGQGCSFTMTSSPERDALIRAIQDAAKAIDPFVTFGGAFDLETVILTFRADAADVFEGGPIWKKRQYAVTRAAYAVLEAAFELRLAERAARADGGGLVNPHFAALSVQASALGLFYEPRETDTVAVARERINTLAREAHGGAMVLESRTRRERKRQIAAGQLREAAWACLLAGYDVGAAMRLLSHRPAAPLFPDAATELAS